MSPKLAESYYLQTDVVFLAKDLIGKRLCARIDGVYTTGLISETEAYAGIEDKASHAYGGKYTQRTKTMYAKGGTAYVYLCYGVHQLFNVVTHTEGVPHAILIRGIKPEEGLEQMLLRRKRTHAKGIADGPGKLTKAMGITGQHNAISLLDDSIWIEYSEVAVPHSCIETGPRIGIDYAEEHKDLPYRFLWK